MATYEMLWNCTYCGTKKLLGKTHRFCPGCGAPQDPAQRYYPPEAEKIAVEDHEYVGADRTCGACGSPMSAKAAHCSQCGSSLTGAGQVRRIAEARPQPLPASSRSRGGIVGCFVIGVLLVILLLVGLFWRKHVSARVTGQTWQRSITLERLVPKQSEEWCDALPNEARDVSRRQEVRERRRVPDGEDCRPKRVDQGDGTYREERECTPRFREEPVYAERCRFTVDSWQTERTVEAQGTGLTPAPSWPPLSLRGGEREGARRATYRVRFHSSAGADFECEVGESAWGTYEADSRWRVGIRRLTGSVACGTLQRE